MNLYLILGVKILFLEVLRYGIKSERGVIVMIVYKVLLCLCFVWVL